MSHAVGVKSWMRDQLRTVALPTYPENLEGPAPVATKTQSPSRRLLGQRPGGQNPENQAPVVGPEHYKKHQAAMPEKAPGSRP